MTVAAPEPTDPQLDPLTPYEQVTGLQPPRAIGVRQVMSLAGCREAIARCDTCDLIRRSADPAAITKQARAHVFKSAHTVHVTYAHGPHITRVVLTPIYLGDSEP